MSHKVFAASPSESIPNGAAPNKIGLTVNPWAGKQLLKSDFEEMREFLDEAAAAGFGYAEIGGCGLGVVIGGKVQRARIDALRAALAGCPLQLTLHSSWHSSGRTGNLLDPASARAQSLGLLADLEIAGAIGAEVLVYHAGVLPNRYSDGEELTAGMATERTMLRDLAEEAGARGVMIAVENRAPTPAVLTRRSYGMRLDAVAEQVALIDHPAVSMCLDIGHAFLAASYLNFDFAAAIAQVAPAVGHIHLHDNFGRMARRPEAGPYELELLGEGDLHLPPGWGSIPLTEVFSTAFPRDPAIIVEMGHARHYAEALATTRALLAVRNSS
ncbi:sugar phosphate isomerase/epimerase family protein [Nocardia mangyaensis]|uniref:sugar phosphate isomerase/epimerase family protein n=1 Tax=Nocardia mangyaensis TaxID=2213200 RepID=UPI0026758D42|nr:sugar phosphate isomerase/epimerase [Nocardia mangyaensis]MDO3648390.1 sugar phosphate isomerase/epimerase [Nocardia mangyaensis]